MLCPRRLGGRAFAEVAFVVAASAGCASVPPPEPAPPVAAPAVGVAVQVPRSESRRVATAAAAARAVCARDDESDCTARCDAGDAESCTELGWIYYEGRGVAKDEVRAARRFQQACDGRSMNGCYGLGAMYRLGTG